VGRKSFIEDVKDLLGFRAKGRQRSERAKAQGASFERARLSTRLFSGPKKAI
jgi:hypothetical protein